MTSITIKNLDDDLAILLQQRAKDRGHSPEEEAKEILRTVLTKKNIDPPLNLAAAIEGRFAGFGYFEIPALVREPLREPPQF